tara:strand:+ start:173 stop:589 length:417 start_codon:yes stop_codon:yes gene_type:complete
MKNYVLILSIFLTSCATFQSEEVTIDINLTTLNKENKTIDAVCSLYSSSAKIDILAPKRFQFVTECSAINIVCKSGDLRGQYGIIKEEETNTNFIINSGIGYIFDRAVDSITPLGTLMNFVNTSDECELQRDITIVLE